MMRAIQLAVACVAVLVATAFEAQAGPIYSFTNAGATGRLGPTQAQVNTEYASTSLAGLVTSNSGIQLWEAPTSGVYRITAAGAQGGPGTNIPNGGLGAWVSGEFQLLAGDVLQILVGQQGLEHGGGGGSFVATLSADPLLVAGGGGSGASFAGQPAWADAAGTLANYGNSGSLNGVSLNNGGVNGDGGDAGNFANETSAGGGFFSNGAGIDFGLAFVNGGLGGDGASASSSSARGTGGFGGGGGRRGGGGGYSGGGAAGWGSGIRVGGGGGSFNLGNNPEGFAGFNEGHGFITIEQLSTEVVPEPSSLAVFGIGACVVGVGAARRRRRDKQYQAMA